MNYHKILLPLIALLGLNGCLSTTSNYYVLSVASEPTKRYASSNNMVIGVEKVTVPGYLYKRDVAIATSSSQITLLGNALWGEDLDAGLTNRLIGFLQKKFNQPNVYAYPWGIDTQPNIKVSVQISRFIAQGDKVYLDATWSLEDMKTKRRKAKLFSTTVATSSDVKSVVSAMDKAFVVFEETVAHGIKSF
jgi:cholesterol transport system auxiliary component